MIGGGHNISLLSSPDPRLVLQIRSFGILRRVAQAKIPHMASTTDSCARRKGGYSYRLSNEWEYFDIVKDPDEVNNEYSNPAYQERINFLKKRIAELKKKLGDDDKYANAKEYGPIE